MDAQYWEAVLSRDGRMDGKFFYAVKTTGVYCRPSCKSRMPRRENVLFFGERESAERAGFRACKRCGPVVSAGAIEQACRYIEAHLDEPLTLAALGRAVGLSPFHLQRTFRAATGVPPQAYAAACRMRSFRAGLQSGHAVTEALYAAGYGSASRVYEGSAAQLGMTPSEYARGGPGISIYYSICDSPFGKLLIAATARGVCSIQFGDTEAQLRFELESEFPGAALAQTSVEVSLPGFPLSDLPLDIQATAFQRRVWEHLQTIPAGRTESYSDVARAIGQPKAARAVARACASNPVAVAIPCHRVVRDNGDLGGYKWGLERKKALLESER